MKPGPMQESCVISKATPSAAASPLAESPTEPDLVFESRPWPHSCCMTSEISPVLAQPLPDLKKLTLEPSQYALQTSLMLTLTVTFELNQESALAFTPLSHFWPIRRTLLRW